MSPGDHANIGAWRSREGTERGFDRLVFFSDAVVAIAITLLILPVVDSVSADTSSGLFDDGTARIGAFLLSFVVIAWFWIVHHRIFERFDGYNTWLVWANMLWLGSIVFLPVPTELIGVRGTHEAKVRLLYIATVLVSSASLLLIELVVAKTPTLWTSDDPSAYSLIPGIVTLVLLVAALVVGTAVEPIGMSALLLLVAATPLGRWLQRRQRGDAPFTKPSPNAL